MPNEKLREAMEYVDRGVEEVLDAHKPLPPVDYSGGKSQLPSKECRELAIELKKRYDRLESIRDDTTKAMCAVNAALDALK